jgi:hypothetical protein
LPLPGAAKAHLPTNLLLVEQWSEKATKNYYLSSDLGAVTVLGKVVDVRIFEANSIKIC